jgi:hypothetical protein
MRSIRQTVGCLSCFFILLSSFAQASDSIPSYTSVHYKGSAVMSNGENFQGCQYNVVSVIDSFLYVQLHFAGIEAGKVLATPDNILFINKLQKNFYSGDYSVFETLLDMEIDFFILQDLLNGNLISPPEEVELYYQTDSLSFEYPFFKMLTGEYHNLSLKIDVKKVTFNKVPEVSATVPRNFTAIEM